MQYPTDMLSWIMFMILLIFGFLKIFAKTFHWKISESNALTVENKMFKKIFWGFTNGLACVLIVVGVLWFNYAITHIDLESGQKLSSDNIGGVLIGSSFSFLVFSWLYSHSGKPRKLFAKIFKIIALIICIMMLIIMVLYSSPFMYNNNCKNFLSVYDSEGNIVYSPLLDEFDDVSYSDGIYTLGKNSICIVGLHMEPGRYEIVDCKGQGIAIIYDNLTNMIELDYITIGFEHLEIDSLDEGFRYDFVEGNAIALSKDCSLGLKLVEDEDDTEISTEEAIEIDDADKNIETNE